MGETEKTPLRLPHGDLARSLDVLQALCHLFGIEGPVTGLTVTARLNQPPQIAVEGRVARTPGLEAARGDFLASLSRD
jgi:hypothetical protein